MLDTMYAKGERTAVVGLSPILMCKNRLFREVVERGTGVTCKVELGSSGRSLGTRSCQDFGLANSGPNSQHLGI